jgi:hypothetical protein
MPVRLFPGRFSSWHERDHLGGRPELWVSGRVLRQDLPAEEVPYLAIPLHTVIKLTPRAYGCTEKRFKMLVEDLS